MVFNMLLLQYNISTNGSEVRILLPGNRNSLAGRAIENAGSNPAPFRSDSIMAKCNGLKIH